MEKHSRPALALHIHLTHNNFGNNWTVHVSTRNRIDNISNNTIWDPSFPQSLSVPLAAFFKMGEQIDCHLMQRIFLKHCSLFK